jgi:hypothetical protein
MIRIFEGNFKVMYQLVFSIMFMVSKEDEQVRKEKYVEGSTKSAGTQANPIVLDGDPQSSKVSQEKDVDIELEM